MFTELRGSEMRQCGLKGLGRSHRSRDRKFVRSGNLAAVWLFMVSLLSTFPARQNVVPVLSDARWQFGKGADDLGLQPLRQCERRCLSDAALVVVTEYENGLNIRRRRAFLKQTRPIPACFK